MKSKKKKYSESESESSEESSGESSESSSSDSSASSGYSSKKRKAKHSLDTHNKKKLKEKKHKEESSSSDEDVHVSKKSSKHKKSKKSDSDSEDEYSKKAKVDEYKLKSKESRKRYGSSDTEEVKVCQKHGYNKDKEDKRHKDTKYERDKYERDKYRDVEHEERVRYHDQGKQKDHEKKHDRSTEVGRRYDDRNLRRERDDEKKWRRERDDKRNAKRERDDRNVRREREDDRNLRRERDRDQKREKDERSHDKWNSEEHYSGERKSTDNERWKHDGYEKRYGRNRDRSAEQHDRRRGDRSPRFGRNNNRNNNFRRNKNSERSRSKSFDHANAKWGKEDKQASKQEKDKPVEKQKPNFALSGKLTEETNTYRGIVIKYSEPPEARKPRRRWRLYPFKGEKALQTLYIHRESAYLIGRERKVVDLPVDHPSCSKQHAVLQYRLVPFTREDGTVGKRVRPYLIDLDSANGTYINNKRIEPRKYVELLEKDVIKFGFSSREYVLLHENSKDETLDDDVKQEEDETLVKDEPED